MSRDGFGRPIPRHAACLFSIARLNLVLTYGISPDFRGGVHLFIQTAIRHRVSSKFIGPHAIAYRWRSLPIVRRRRASKPQGSSSNGCCLCITMKQLICLSFPHPLWKTIRNKTLSAMSQTRLKTYSVFLSFRTITIGCCCCCLHIKSRSGLYSVLSNIRTGPTDADAFRGHRLTTQKGYTYHK